MGAAIRKLHLVFVKGAHSGAPNVPAALMMSAHAASP